MLLLSKKKSTYFRKLNQYSAKFRKFRSMRRIAVFFSFQFLWWCHEVNKQNGDNDFEICTLLSHVYLNAVSKLNATRGDFVYRKEHHRLHTEGKKMKINQNSIEKTRNYSFRSRKGKYPKSTNAMLSLQYW